MWLRAPDELIGRPFWIIGLASLAVAAALLGNPIGAVSWGIALILLGGALFLASVQQIWISRALLIGAFSLSALPFSLTASGWQGNISKLLVYHAFPVNCSSFAHDRFYSKRIAAFNARLA